MTSISTSGFSRTGERPRRHERTNVWRSCARVFAAALIVQVAFAVTSDATTLVPMSLAELSHDATAIARGRVAAVETRPADDRHSVETIVTLDVESWLKGGSGPTVRFVVPGGALGRYRTVVVGAPAFTVDDRVIVFLAGGAPALPHIVGFSQGVYRVVRPSEPGRRGPAQPQVVGGGLGAPAPGGGSERGPAALDAFETQVREFGRRQK